MPSIKLTNFLLVLITPLAFFIYAMIYCTVTGLMGVNQNGTLVLAGCAVISFAIRRLIAIYHNRNVSNEHKK